MRMVTWVATLSTLAMRTKNVLWVGYTLVPKMHMLTAWFPGSDIIK